MAASRLSIAQFSPMIDKISDYISAWPSYVRTFPGVEIALQKKAFSGLERSHSSKVGGRFGHSELQSLEQSLLSKTLWDIQAKKDSLWVQWVHQIYMNRVGFWEYQNKHEDSPLLKQVITLRDEIIAAED